MNSSILALRAITAVTLRRILMPVLIIMGLVVICIYAGVIYLTSQLSGWWGILLVPVIPLLLLCVLLGIGLWVASGKLFPQSYQSSHRKQIVAFSDKVMWLVENSKTPYPVHLFLVGKDVIRGRESTHIKKLIGDSSTLKRDFDDIRKLF